MEKQEPYQPQQPMQQPAQPKEKKMLPMIIAIIIVIVIVVAALFFFAFGDIGNQDIVYDLGCGDGRFVFEASKKAKKAIGYELSIPLYLLGKIRSLFYKKKAKIRFGDFFKQDLSDADIIFCYLMPKAIQRFYKELWPTLKPGTRFITNQFPIKNLQPVQTKDKVYMYIV